ncbi:hypothetical protein J3Q64DRAFT_1702787 [Phycomyces blakesleeanus]|uniref:Uncharacterized protein n=1 Tax=Phycomyces blakesleeanus TaxID=4837 RepID=A0ABR3APX5_PHYBL
MAKSTHKYSAYPQILHNLISMALAPLPEHFKLSLSETKVEHIQCSDYNEYFGLSCSAMRHWSIQCTNFSYMLNARVTFYNFAFSLDMLDIYTIYTFLRALGLTYSLLKPNDRPIKPNVHQNSLSRKVFLVVQYLRLSLGQ